MAGLRGMRGLPAAVRTTERRCKRLIGGSATVGFLHFETLRLRDLEAKSVFTSRLVGVMSGLGQPMFRNRCATSCNLSL